LPSVPTSRATRVTSEVKTESCSIIVLRAWPSAGTRPLSSRPSTRAPSLAEVAARDGADRAGDFRPSGRTRSSISVLNDSASAGPSRRRHRAATCADAGRPSRPTVPAQASDLAGDALGVADRLVEGFAIRASSPGQCNGSRTEKSPSREGDHRGQEDL
jgi:hypothetical protein